MGKQVAVIGLGLFGTTLAREATAIGHDVLGIDKDERRVEALKEEVAHAVRGDALEPEVLQRMGVDSCHTAIVAIGADELSNIMVTMNLMNMGIKNVISRAANELHAKILERLGVSHVALPERETGVRLAHTFASPHILEYLELTPSHGVSKIQAPEHMVGKSLLDTGLSFKYGLQVLLLVRGNQVMVNPPGLTTRVREGDTLVVVGDDEAVEKVRPG